MAKTLELRNAAGEPLAAFDFGEVQEGGQSQPVPLSLVNTGDTPLTSLTAWIEQASTADGFLRAQFGGTEITGMSEATATALTPPAPGETLSGEAWFMGAQAGRGVPMDTGTLEIRFK